MTYHLKYLLLRYLKNISGSFLKVIIATISRKELDKILDNYLPESKLPKEIYHRFPTKRLREIQFNRSLN